jgi:formate hydrogenlyase subunit 4
MMDFFNWLILATIFLLLPIVGGGVIRKVRAMCQRRRGTPLLQSFYDAMRMMKKEPVDSKASNIFALLSPPIALLSSIVLWSIVVFEWTPFILILFWIALYRMAILTYSMQAGTSFGGLGASREILLSITGEPILLLIILVAQSKIHVEFSIEAALLGILIFIVASVPILSESAKPPFDDPRTHLELTMVHEAMLLEASGKSMAFFSIAADIKMLSLIVFVFRLSIEHSKLVDIHLFYQNFLVLVGSFLFLIYLGFWEGTSVRRKWKWVPEIMGLTFLLLLILGTLIKLIV